MSATTDVRETYFELMTANGISQVFHAAQRLGIFDALRDGPKSAREIASHAALAERPTSLLLAALVKMEILIASDGTFRLAPVMEILSGPYRRLGDEYWSHLDEWLRTGEPCREMDVNGEAAYREQARSLAWMLQPAATEAAAILRPRLAPAPDILDLGAGSGVWSLTLGATVAGASLTLVDRPAVLDVAREFAEATGCRARFLPGDLRDLVLQPRTFDLILVANVCHLLPRDECRGLFRRAAGWLKPGGTLAVIEVFSESPEGGLAANLYHLGLALRTRHGTVHPATDLTAWLTECGLIPQSVTPIAAAPQTLGILGATSAASRSSNKGTRQPPRGRTPL